MRRLKIMTLLKNDKYGKLILIVCGVLRNFLGAVGGAGKSSQLKRSIESTQMINRVDSMD